MSVPDYRHSPGGDLVNFKILAEGSLVVRIFDANKAREGGYSAFDFNPTILEDRPDQRGRYSACSAKFRKDVYSYLYVGEVLTDERAAFLECIDVLSLGRDEGGVRRRLRMRALNPYAFAYSRCARDLILLDISNRPYADVFKAPWEVLQGKNHRLTRRWARYFRSKCKNIDGLYYCPVRYGNTEAGGNVVLFAEHGTNGDQLTKDSEIISMRSSLGRQKLRNLARYGNFTVT